MIRINLINLIDQHVQLNTECVVRSKVTNLGVIIMYTNEFAVHPETHCYIIIEEQR